MFTNTNQLLSMGQNFNTLGFDAINGVKYDQES
jgi:hypothetical protein